MQPALTPSLRILICGASGFLGRHLEQRLCADGHTVVRGLRQPQRPGDLRFDFAEGGQAGEWARQLAGIDVVINCVGILVESDEATFFDLHQRGPQQLFAACVAGGVRRVVQVSALGAARGDTPYFASKRAADEFLMQQPIAWQIVRPSLVYGPDGRSARFFRQLASLPLLPLPAGGSQPLQPIHIDDLCAAVATLLDPATPAGQCLDLVGPTPTTTRHMLLDFRRAMGLPPAFCLNIPAGLMQLAASLLGHLPGSLLTPDNWKMLQAGSTGDAAPTTALLGRPLRPLARFIPPGAAEGARLAALAAWRNPLMRLALALVWIITGEVSLGIYPVEDSLALLARTGLSGLAALIALYGAAGLDLAFGWATLFRPGRRLWLAQMVLIAGYSLIIALCLPETLAHPFGPLTKNLPILALLFVLLSEETAA